MTNHNPISLAIRPKPNHDPGLVQDPRVPNPLASLACMPEEILLAISNDECLDIDSVRNLALTSTKMRRVASPRFYQGFGYLTFGKAVLRGDLDAIKRCADYNAAPANHAFPSPFGFDIKIHMWRFYIWEGQTPMMLAIDSFQHKRAAHPEKSIPIQNYYDVMQWLLEHGADPDPALRDRRIRYVRPPLDHIMAHIIAPAPSREQSDTMHQMAHLLLNHGARVPGEILDLGYRKVKAWQLGCYGSWTIVEYLLQMTVEPSLMQLWLKKLQECDIALTDRFADSHALELIDGRQMLSGCSIPKAGQLSIILEQLFPFLIDKTNTWQEKYPGEALDMFSTKIDLLSEYRAVNEAEESSLRDVLTASREIYESRPNVDYTEPENMLQAWYKLCMAARRMADPGYLKDEEQRFRTDGERLHALLIEQGWDPRISFVMHVLTTRISDYTTHGLPIRMTDNGRFAGPWFEAGYEQWRGDVMAAYEAEASFYRQRRQLWLQELDSNGSGGLGQDGI